MKKQLVLTGLVTAALAVGVSMAPTAEAATASRTTLRVDGCYGTEDIALRGSPAHDYMTWTVPSTVHTCIVDVIDNGYVIERIPLGGGVSHASGGWYYDGPGHWMQICLTVPPHGLSFGGRTCGPLN